MGRYLKGNVDESLSLGTLAAKTLISADFDEAVSERTFVTSLKALYALENYSPAAGIGPILVGIAHSDYSDAEIEEFIETVSSWDEGNLVEGMEVRRRLIRKIGIFSEPSSATDETVVLNHGNPIRTKLNWMLRTGQTINLWAYNMGTAPVAQTVPVVHCQGHANLWPR